MATETFTSSGTFNCPSNVNYIAVVCTGGGGGGGADGDGNRVGTGGGGAGTAFRKETVTPGTAFTVTVGGGGAAADGVGVPGKFGGTGGTSSFTGPSFQNISASGGEGGGPGDPNILGGAGSGVNGNSNWTGSNGQNEAQTTSNNLPSSWDTSSGCNNWDIAVRSGGGGRAGSSASGTGVKCPSRRRSCSVETIEAFQGNKVNRQQGRGASSLNVSWNGSGTSVSPSFSYGDCSHTGMAGRSGGAGGAGGWNGGGGGNGGAGRVWIQYNPVSPPTISDFAADKTIICPGSNPAVLSWSLTGPVTSLTLNGPGTQTTALSTGTTSVTVGAGTYSITASNIGGSSQSSSITISDGTDTTANFDAAGATIKFGETDTFAWTVTGTNATASINQGIGAVSLTGSQTVTGTYDIIYTLSASGTCASSSDTYNLQVLMFPPDPTDWTIDAVSGQDPAGSTGDRTIYANQFPNLTFNWDYDFSLLGEISAQYIQALYLGTTYEYQVTPNSARSETLNDPWSQLSIPYDSTVQFRLRVLGPNDESKFTDYISISTVGPVSIDSFTANPNPQFSLTGTPQFSTLLEWDVSNSSGNPSNISITSGTYSVTSLNDIGNTTVNNLPQSTAGTLSPATRTFTMNASNPGSTDSQDLVVEVFNDNTPSSITVAPLTQNGNVPIGSLESATEYFTQISFTGTDMPVIVNAGSGAIAVTNDLVNVSGSILLPAGDGNFFIKYESLPYNNSTVPGGTNSFGEIVGQPNSKTISFSIGSVASSFVITTRPPVIEETFDTEPLPLSPLAYPFPDIDTLSLPGEPVQFAQTPAVPLDDIEIDNEIKVDDPNVQVLINGTLPWKDMREI